MVMPAYVQEAYVQKAYLQNTEAVKHEWLAMYDNCRECMIVYSWGFLLYMLVSALLGNTFLFKLSRTRPFEIGAIPCSGVSVTTHEVTWGTHVVSPFDHRVLFDLEDRRRRLRYRGECSLDFIM